METEDMILAREFCIHYNIELSLIHALHESGLVEIVEKEEDTFLPLSQIIQLEKLVRLHNEMDINIEGIETISYLLKRINEMQQQISNLNNKLDLYNETLL